MSFQPLVNIVKVREKLAYYAGGVRIGDEVGKGGGRLGCFLRPCPHLHAPASQGFAHFSDESCLVLCFWPLSPQLCLDCSPLISSILLSPQIPAFSVNCYSLTSKSEQIRSPWPSQSITSISVLTARGVAHASASLIRSKFFGGRCHT